MVARAARLWQNEDMNPDQFYQRIVKPTLQLMAEMPEINVAVSDKASVLVMTIAGQEGNWQHRRQIGGPARSFWQFEKFGGVAELLQKTPKQLSAICAYLDIPYDMTTVFEAMAWNDTLSCAMGRLLVWQDPKSLPEIGDKDGSWAYYLRNWRPGAPHPAAWPALYDKAVAAVIPKPKETP